ncbi:MAG: glycoside hydrolase family 13 protein [Acidimicrobiia bacterium]
MARNGWDRCPLHLPPQWVLEGDPVFYQIFPDRFAKSDRVRKPTNLQDWDAPPTPHGYKGGDLLGIVEHLDYLADLGINALYLNPVFVSGSNHRYHTDDYYTVDPLLGGNEAIDELIASCHDRGIRVILDGVFNHVGRGFHEFHDILENDGESPYVDWFNIDKLPLNPYCDGPPNYEAWWNIKALPRLNNENPQVREYIMEVAEHWVRRGIDGWRLDVPEEIKADGFWEEFRQRVRKVNPEAYIVGEIWHDAGEYLNDGTRFDATMNYVLTVAILSFAAGDRIDAGELVRNEEYRRVKPIDAIGYAKRIDRLLSLYRPETHQANLNLLESHDTVRFLTTASGDRDSLILATLLTMTFPGAPCIYYGSEVGLPGSKDPDCRRGFPWHESQWEMTLLDAHRSLIALRHAHPALRAPGYREVSADGHLYVFERFDDTERLLVAVNAGAGSAAATIGSGSLEILWGTASTIGGTITVPARAGAVWRVG